MDPPGLPAYAWLPFLTGLLGGAHCIGMCGGFVLALGLRRTGGILWSQLLYNAGRILTYAVLGAFFGAATSFGRGAAVFGPWRAAVLFFAGTFMLLLALNILGVLGRSWEFPAFVTSGRFAGILGRLSAGGPAASFPLGILMGFVPCGLVYTMLLSAAASGSPAAGALLMAAFGLGTLPAMLGLGFISARLTPGSRAHLYQAAAVVVIVMALRFILQGAALLGWIPHARFW